VSAPLALAGGRLIRALGCDQQVAELVPRDFLAAAIPEVFIAE
jgi:hypothetical protein